MRMNEPLRWNGGLGGPVAFANTVGNGQAVDVTRRAPRWFEGHPVAIETEVYDRYVAWDGDAQRRHCIALDEAHRLEVLLDASGYAAFGAGGCFVCRAADAQALHFRTASQVFSMTNYAQGSTPFWMIHR